MPPSSQDKLEALRQKRAQLDAKIQAIAARDAQKARALDTRRKVILGGLLLEAASKNQWPKNIKEMLSWLTRENDQKAFDGWTPPGEPAAKIDNTEKGDTAPTSETSEG
jgi:hypothetical protein